MNTRSTTPDYLRWTPLGRFVIFFLAASSIWCLLAEFYHVVSMRAFTFCVLIPCTIILIAVTMYDFFKGDRKLYRAVIVGSIAGFIAAVAYDIFRLPFVYAHAWGIDGVVPQMQLFKVFPRFGAMILGQPIEQPSYSLAAHLIGWTYHFSNGITFGIMYMALVGEASRRSWWWAVLFATGLELAMLYTPYTTLFSQ